MSLRKAGDASPVEAHSPDLDPFIKMFSRDEMGKTQTDMTAGGIEGDQGTQKKYIKKSHFREQMLVNTPCVFPKA